MRTISWFEIPTTELGRAVAFYQTMLGQTLQIHSGAGPEMALFPCTAPNTSGALVRDPRHLPAAGGTVVYFAVDELAGSLDGCLERAAQAGGQVVVPRMDIGEHGFIGIVKDTEGNLIGLHIAAA